LICFGRWRLLLDAVADTGGSSGKSCNTAESCDRETTAVSWVMSANFFNRRPTHIVLAAVFVAMEPPM